ncbi:MAG: hypothetical protein ACRDMV_18215 [Streptosporangiales bacterium]
MNRDMSSEAWRLLASDRAQASPRIDRAEQITTEIMMWLPEVVIGVFSVVVAVAFAWPWALLLTGGVAAYTAVVLTGRAIGNRNLRVQRVRESATTDHAANNDEFAEVIDGEIVPDTETEASAA